MRDTVAMIGEQRGALLAHLGGLDADGWAAPSPCEGWSVADVVAHLIEGELGVGRVLRGETEPGFIDLTDIDRWRALPGEALGAALWQHGTATQRLLATMDAARWHAPIRAFGCRRISQLARLGLFEAVVHSYDITAAAGAPPIWGPRIRAAAEHVLRTGPLALTRRGAEPDGILGITLGARTASLAGTPDGWRLLDGLEGSARASLTIEPDALVLVTTGRSPIDQTLAEAGVEGDGPFAKQMLERWQVVAF